MRSVPWETKGPGAGTKEHASPPPPYARQTASFDGELHAIEAQGATGTARGLDLELDFGLFVFRYPIMRSSEDVLGCIVPDFLGLIRATAYLLDPGTPGLVKAGNRSAPALLLVYR